MLDEDGNLDLTDTETEETPDAETEDDLALSRAFLDEFDARGPIDLD
jgi:hypothetical protein